MNADPKWLTDARVAMQRTREFVVGTGFGVPEDAYDDYIDGMIRAALPIIREGLAKEIEHAKSASWPVPTEVGSRPSYGYGVEDALTRAARIVRSEP
jgi:hypothetical protein